MLKYRFYATILDGYQNYLSSSEIYQEYWGFSEDPEKTEEEFEQEQFQSLIDRINRVPFDNEKADRGTAFNEVIDCLIENRSSLKMEIRSEKETGLILVNYNQRTFAFQLDLCLEFAKYFKGAVTQVYVDGLLSTRFGDVLLYGYIDELMPHSVHDIKTTEKYKSGKFRSNWQHIVYPYCLNVNGNMVMNFEYNVAVLGPKSYSTHTEFYSFKPERDIPRLTAHVESLIEFIEANRSLITDQKIFNQILETV
jgi:hypothetical protein